MKQNSFPVFEIGIGIGSSQDLIIKARKKHSGISENIWIGDAVVNASKLSSEANRSSVTKPIVIDENTYENIKDFYANKQYKYSYYFEKKYSHKLGEYVNMCDIINIGFNDWINNGMKL